MEDFQDLCLPIWTEMFLLGRRRHDQARPKNKQEEKSGDRAVDRPKQVGYNAPCFAGRR